MKIVIDIPEEVYNRCKEYRLQCGEAEVLESSVARGTPLQKGHGRLIDADALYDEYVKEPEEFNVGHSLMALFRVEPTVIEITAEMNLKNIIAESMEVAQALNEFADDLERIEKKYAELQSADKDCGLKARRQE